MKYLLVAFTFLISTAVSAEIYKWKDSSGAIHFSDEKPADTEFEIVKDKLTNTQNNIAYTPNEPRNGLVLFESKEDLTPPYKIKLHEVKVFSETESTLTVDFIYTYKSEIPENEIRVFVMPDHSYWSTNDVKISRGTNGARAIIGLSKRNMEKDFALVSETTKLRFRFDRYQPKKYLGNVWGQDIEFHKMWKKKRL